jgi:hypothetical protein
MIERAKLANINLAENVTENTPPRVRHFCKAQNPFTDPRRGSEIRNPFTDIREGPKHKIPSLTPKGVRNTKSLH